MCISAGEKGHISDVSAYSNKVQKYDQDKLQWSPR